MSKLILIIDQNPDLQNLYEAILSDESYATSPHPSLPPDLELIKQLNPDLMIIDLPFDTENSDWPLIQKLKLDPRTVSIPIILLTTNPVSLKPLQSYLTEKNIPVILKPFDIDQLLDTIRKTLEIPHS